MRRFALLALVVGFLVPLFVSAPVHAQASRTWVSGIGDDANPCSRTAPCKTFAGAISKTATRGEINCLDPGGFGAVTITKSITLDCHEVFASILVSGTNGIVINATSAIVTLRNLNIDGIGFGLNGVNIITAARVNIEDMTIMGFAQRGILDTRTGTGNQLFVKNTTIRNNAAAGIVAAAGAGGTSSTVLDNVHSVSNQFGFAAATGNNVMINRSLFSGNSDSGVEADLGAQVTVDNSVISHNDVGVTAIGSIRLSNSDISFNSTGISGATTSFGNNRISGNVSAGTAPTPAGSAAPALGQQ